MNQILAALLNAQPATNSASSTSSATTTTASADSGSAAQFKSQFDQAVTTLSNAVNSNAQSANATQTTGAAQATTAGSSVQSAALADSLQAALQKKIADLLAKGESVAEIVQQLAASLATTIAQQFGGSQTQIQNQLQTAFAAALAPPTITGTGPPPSTADLASALAQRFRQVADVAAGVLGETGQSNRLFAGSISDAATTAGEQPAPPTNDPTPADSMASNAAALFASLTAPKSPSPPAAISDGKTVASNGTQAQGSNGDTLLGRILTRAIQSQATSAPAPETPASTSDSANLTANALASAVAVLSSAPAAPALAPSAASAASAASADVTAAATQRVITSADSTPVIATEVATAPATPAPLNPVVTAFLKTFSDALASQPASSPSGKTSADSDAGTILPTDVSSAQAPTIGAFAPVQAAVQNDPTQTGGSQSPSNVPLPSQTTADSNAVIEQVLRGAFINTAGDSSTVRLRLVPETLGDISVRLTIEGNNVSANVMAQTPAAHDALVAGQAQLTRSLADAGLKLTSFNVDLAGGFASFQQQQQQQSSQQGSSNGRSPLGGVDTPETDESTLTAEPNFGPPVLAGSNWSQLNYLV